MSLSSVANTIEICNKTHWWCLMAIVNRLNSIFCHTFYLFIWYFCGEWKKQPTIRSLIWVVINCNLLLDSLRCQSPTRHINKCVCLIFVKLTFGYFMCRRLLVFFSSLSFIIINIGRTSHLFVTFGGVERVRQHLFYMPTQNGLESLFYV